MAEQARLDWDSGNIEKCRKHGVTRDEIEAMFASGTAWSFPDVAHSQSEDRFIAVGRSRSGRPLFVIFTLRQADGVPLVRPVSARYMHAKEVKRYEQASEAEQRSENDD
ncbi:BrnT family toxin [Devosia sp.]|uniref:BrnT family toxin n=1 Tax=Devosia sp. TaxID=1871048 RepID=UPI003BAB64C4